VRAFPAATPSIAAKSGFMSAMRGKMLVGGLTPIILLAMVVAGGAYFGRVSAAKKMRIEREKEQQAIATVPVTQGDFEVAVISVGKLDAVESKQVMAEISGEIVKIVPNGARVKKDDVIAVLDVPRMARQTRDMQSQYDDAVAQLERRKRDLAAEVERAKLALEQAQKELDRFESSEQAAIDTKKGQKSYDEQDLSIGRTRFDRKDKLANQALIPKREVELATADIKAKEFGLERESKDLDLAEARKASETLDKQAAVNKAKADLARAEAAQQDETRNAQMNVDINKQQLTRAKDQLSKAVIKATGDGIVVLAEAGEFGATRSLEAGDRVWESMRVATIPDLSKMRVVLDLPQEQSRSVKRKQKAIITVDAVPGVQFPAEVGEVSQTAKEATMRGTGIPTGERAFPTKIDITDLKKAPLRPGMTANVRIITERLPKAISIPIECVFDEDDRKIVYVDSQGHFSPTEVELGPQNTDMVVVKHGLKPGERIALRDIGARGARVAPDDKKKGPAELPL
jgi:HlyD family secretion protein